MLPVLWVGLWLMWRGLSRGDNRGEVASQGAGSGADDVSPARPGPSPRWIGLIAIVGIALYVVHAGYGFRGSFRPWGEFGFISRTLNGNERFGTPGNRWAGTMWANVPVPLPAEYVRGIDVQRSEFERGKWSYLRGEQKHGGWWWYYLYAFGVKTPLGTLALLAVALLSAGQRRGRARRRDELVLLAPALAVLVLVSSQTGFNRYLRYALPAVPFVFIGMSRVASEGRSVTIGAGRGCRLQWRRLVVMGCLVLSSIGSLAVWPYSLSFFNRLAGGPARGHRHLLDANLDWGQGLLALRDWLEDHPEARPLFLTDFGWVDPRLAGISARPVPRLLLDTDGTIKAGVPEQILPGWYAISINRVMGYRHDESDRPVFTWLQEFEPIATPGGSLWVYHLTETDVRAFAERHPRASAKK